MVGLETILRVCIKISGLVLVLVALFKSLALTIATSGYSGFDTYMFIQQLLIILLGVYLLIGGERLVKMGIRHPEDFTSRLDFNTVFALGIKIIGLVIILEYSITVLDYLRFYLSTKMMNQGDMPIHTPEFSSFTLLLNIIIIIIGFYFFHDGKTIRKIASYKLNCKVDNGKI